MTKKILYIINNKITDAFNKMTNPIVDQYLLFEYNLGMSHALKGRIFNFF